MKVSKGNQQRLLCTMLLMQKG